MDMLDWGSTWLTTVTGASTQRECIVTTDGLSIPVSATVVDEAGRLIPGTVGLSTEHTKFLFETAELVAAGITFKRNTVLTIGTNMYHVVQTGNQWWTYNDTYKKQTVVTAKHVPYTTS